MIDPNEVLSELAKTASEAEAWNKSERLRAVTGIWMLIDALEKYVAENDVHDRLQTSEKMGAVKKQIKKAFESDEDDAKEVKQNLFETWCLIGNLRVTILGEGET